MVEHAIQDNLNPQFQTMVTHTWLRVNYLLSALLKKKYLKVCCGTSSMEIKGSEFRTLYKLDTIFLNSRDLSVTNITQ